VHVDLFNVLLLWEIILHSCKPCKPLLENENPQWITVGDQHVEPQIKLKSVYQIWPFNVLLNHRFTQLLLHLSGKEIDTLSLWSIIGFPNIGLLGMHYWVLVEFGFVKGHGSCFGVEIVIFGELLIHPI